jgi:hypothetical protein
MRTICTGLSVLPGKIAGNSSGLTVRKYGVQGFKKKKKNPLKEFYQGED